MIDENLARMRAHRNNIHRYRRLLSTSLSDLERDFIQKRLEQERATLESLAGSTFPFTLPLSRQVPATGGGSTYV
jgi:hypothetical protein